MVRSFLRRVVQVLGAGLVVGLLAWQPAAAQSGDDRYYEERLGGRGLLLEFTYTPPSSYWSGCNGVVTEEFVVARTYPNEVYMEEVILRDKENFPSKWEVKSFPYWLLKRLPEFFNMGNRLEVSYRNCGSGGYPTFVRARLLCRSQLDGSCKPVAEGARGAPQGQRTTGARPATRQGGAQRQSAPPRQSSGQGGSRVSPGVTPM